MHRSVLALLFAAVLLLSGCAAGRQTVPKEKSGQEAKDVYKRQGWYYIKRRFVENEVGQRFYFDFYGAKWLAFANGPGNI